MMSVCYTEVVVCYIVSESVSGLELQFRCTRGTNAPLVLLSICISYRDGTDHGTTPRTLGGEGRPSIACYTTVLDELRGEYWGSWSSQNLENVLYQFGPITPFSSCFNKESVLLNRS